MKFVGALIAVAAVLASADANADHFSIGWGKALNAYDDAYSDPTTNPNKLEGFSNRLGHVNNSESWNGQTRSLGKWGHGPDGWNSDPDKQLDKGYHGSNAGGDGRRSE